jgi:hypothetical protein
MSPDFPIVFAPDAPDGDSVAPLAFGVPIFPGRCCPSSRRSTYRLQNASALARIQGDNCRTPTYGERLFTDGGQMAYKFADRVKPC